MVSKAIGKEAMCSIRSVEYSHAYKFAKLKPAKNLKHLTLWSWSADDSAAHRFLIKLLPQLEELSIGCQMDYDRLPLEKIRTEVPWNMTKLVLLHLTSIARDPSEPSLPRFFRPVIHACGSNLRELYLRCDVNTSSYLTAIAEECPKLRSLFLTAYHNAQTFTLPEIAPHLMALTNLQRIALPVQWFKDLKLIAANIPPHLTMHQVFYADDVWCHARPVLGAWNMEIPLSDLDLTQQWDLSPTQIGFAMKSVAEYFRGLPVSHIQRLLDAGADPCRPFVRSLQHFHSNGPQAKLAFGNCFDMVTGLGDRKGLLKLLVEYAVKMNLPPSVFFNGDGRTPLFDEFAHTVIQEWVPLLENLKAKHDFDLVSCRNENGDNALTHFMRETVAFKSYFGSVEEYVDAWMDAGADPCALRYDGTDTLTFLVRYCQVKSSDRFFETLLGSRRLSKRLKKLLASDPPRRVATYLANAHKQSTFLLNWVIDHANPEAISIALEEFCAMRFTPNLSELEVRLLVSKGGSVDGILGVCGSPLLAAAEKEWGPMAETLESLGARLILTESQSILHSLVRGRCDGFQDSFELTFERFSSSGKPDFLLASASALLYFGILFSRRNLFVSGQLQKVPGDKSEEAVIESCLHTLAGHPDWVRKHSDHNSRVFVLCLLLLPVPFSSKIPRMKLIEAIWPLVEKADPNDTLAYLPRIDEKRHKYSPLDYLIRSMTEYDFMLETALFMIPKMSRTRHWFQHDYTFAGAVQHFITQYPITGTKEEKKSFMKSLQVILDAFCNAEPDHAACCNLFKSEIRIHKDAEIIKQLKASGYLNKAHKKPFEEDCILGLPSRQGSTSAQ
jgi:hypothetical protein